MAWRLEKAVEHGEIDNTVAGTTTGRIWLRGMDGPLLLALDGDCWRDLAGARLEFTNPIPQDGPNLASLDPDQVGLVGDMTAARKVCQPAARGGDGQARWCNSLYLEWFSEANGRVLIESTTFKLRVSGHAWRMDEDEEDAQKLANLQAMRDFMARMIDRKTDEGDDDDHDTRLFDEHEWEAMLKESDRVSRAFGEVLEKYGDDPESERKEAFVMGWDRKLEALADREEAWNGRNLPPDDGATDEEDNADDDDDEVWEGSMDGFPDLDELDDDDFDGDEEPIIEKSRELCLRAMDLIDQEAGRGTPAYQVMSGLLEVSSKLAGALDSRYGSPGDTGYVLAILKRCLGLLNDSLGAIQTLVAEEEDADHRAAMEHLMAETFSVRDEIVELRREIREGM